ncbi:hypothetical protein COY62_02620 [bacterium (Candidatus Howlettbacteria) CG_4_10_14_0_8_um_filter_40_9]|nr:MAG: hypothetical protein COY62_02620 [bacterium (Candidatus Howlettbacteria) CG_4_10_14_0_8_um_filter_40_9]
MDKRDFLLKVREKAELKNTDEAEKASKAVMHALRERITPDEAHDLESQFTCGEKELWENGEMKRKFLERLHLKKRGVQKMHRREFLQKVQNETKGMQDAEKTTKAVFSTIKEQVSKGEADDVAAQLPTDLRNMWLKS